MGICQQQELDEIATRAVDSQWDTDPMWSWAQLWGFSARNQNEYVEPGISGLYQQGPTPGLIQYSTCRDMHGLSVWDANGWWRCLFPQSHVESHLIQRDRIADVYTKERIERDSSHQLGCFFTDYSQYLLYRAKVQDIAVARRNKAKKEQDRRWLGELKTPETPENLMLDIGKPKNNVIGTSEYVTYQLDEQGQKEVKKKRTYYDNGQVQIDMETKLNPRNGGAPQVTRSSKTVDAKDDRD